MNRSLTNTALVAAVAAAAMFLAACQSDAVKADGQSAEDQKRAEILAFEKKTLDRLYAENPEARAEIESAPGFAVFDLSSVNAILLVGQAGQGVLVNRKNGTQLFMKAYRAGTGPGLGYQQLAQVFVFKSDFAAEQFALGNGVGGDVSASITAGTSNLQQSFNPEIRVYQLNNKGFALQANWGGTAYVADSDLNPATAAPAQEAAPTESPCPEGPPQGARCLRGVDSKGAHYLIVMPANWNHVLVVHAHGGPPLEAKASRADEDIKRWSIIVRAGYAYAASVYHQGGVAVRSAAEDTERVRRIFVEHVAVPRRTILHGQSWGANVAAKGAEMYAHSAKGHSPYDGVLLTSGVVGGGTQSYNFRLDLRVVYQYLCNNHPKPDEPQYPLWMGLPKDSKLTNKELKARVDECLGLDKPAAQRTPEQARKVKTIVDVIHIQERSIEGHLSWGTFLFRDIVQKRTGGHNPFGNEGVVYRGSSDDNALNAGVHRYRADPQAVATFAEDADLTGKIEVPVLTVHAINDPIAFVELEDTFHKTMEAAGTADHLVQNFGDYHEHSYLDDTVYPTLLAALLQWIDTGTKPTREGIAKDCKAFEAQFGPGCRFDPAYRVAPLDSRVPARGN
jgi:lipid-binding SYLF domain-containing protein